MLRPDLPPLDSYLADALQLPADAFLARYPWPMLVVPEPSADVKYRRRRPETLLHPIGQPTMEIKLPNHGLAGASLDALCLQVRPRKGEQGNRISLGRSHDADVVLLDESISRYHSEIIWGADRERCVLADLGAKNGTFMDGVRLSANGRAELYSGAVLMFGALVTRFYSPKAFLSWLSTGAPKVGASPATWPQR